MNTIETIRAEIERLKADYLNRSYTFVPVAMEHLLDFLSTLEEKSEKPINQDELEEEINRYWKEEMPVVLESDLNDIARHFYELGKQRNN